MNAEKKYNILAVDDAKDTLMLLTFDLEEEGYQVFTAESGELAFDVLKHQSIDLILLDMYMPGISGLSMLQKLKSSPETANIPVIMLSASNEEDQIVAALEFGADDYVTKPYIPKVMFARMRTSLRLLEKTQELETLARTDFLTGINNRGSFEEQTVKAISQAKRTGYPIVIAMLDIDLFKQVNDNYGHEAGDKVLKDFASILEENFRDYDVLGRVGGEEFAVCMTHTTVKNAFEACERFRLSVSGHAVDLSELSQESISVTVSIGIAMSKDEPLTYDELLRKADEALYQAKDNGRNRTHSSSNINDSDNIKETPNPADSAPDKLDVSRLEKFSGLEYNIGVANVLGDDTLFGEILRMFYEDHAKDKDKIEQAISQGDQQACKHLVHTLKGVSCSVGAMELFEVTKKLDVAINEQHYDKYSILFNPVAQELTKVMIGIELAFPEVKVN